MNGNFIAACACVIGLCIIFPPLILVIILWHVVDDYG
jgi:hypothetical protein